MTWSDEREVFRAVWAEDLRLIIAGVDVTELRGAPAEFSNYQLQEPFEYGPASFRFPQVSDLEIRSDEDDLAADLTWMRKRAKVKLVPVVSGVAGTPIWRGFVETIHGASGIVELNCGGDASGRLALDLRPVQLFRAVKDIKTHVFEAFRDTNIPFYPRHGGEIGITLPARGGFEDRLSYVTGLLSDSQATASGVPWTVKRHATKNAYTVALKDLTTVNATIFAGTDGIDIDVSDALSEQPNTFYGSGIAPNGMKWNNGVVPGVYSDAPAYPMAGGADFGEGTDNADTLTGEGISVMHSRLIAVGAMDREDGSGTYDDETTDAVEIIQDRAGLPETGVMDTATWDALYDVTASGYSLRGAQVLPLAQNTQVREWDRTASGNITQKNDDFNPDAIVVARHVPFGVMRKRRARRWARREINRLAGKNWVGTITLDGADVFSGEYEHGDAATLLSRQQIRAGWNILVRGWDGDTLFHIAGVNVSADGVVRLAVDTQARDLRTVTDIVARNREARRNRGREWKQEHRTSGAVHDALIGWFEHGGMLGADVSADANDWTVFPVVGGQEGTVAKLRLNVDNASFAVAVFGEKVTPAWLRSNIGDPFAVDGDGNSIWLTNGQQAKLYTQRTLLYAAGTPEEPCGYWPKRHTNDDGDTTAAPVTGIHVDDGGFPYRCYGDPLLWVAVYPLDDATVKSGRIMWEQIEEGA